MKSFYLRSFVNTIYFTTFAKVKQRKVLVMAKSIRESEIKNRIRQEYFSDYDWTKALGDIDLTVCSNPIIGTPQVTYLWCETKNGTKRDIYESFIQLIITIGKARTYESEMPPYFLGAADAEKIAFVEYSKVMQIFSKTDFNWNVTPSDHSTKEFKELYNLLHDELANDVVIFKFAFDDKTLRRFIKKNFREGRDNMAKISVGKNNFTYVYYDWVKSVKDTIAVDWQMMQKAGILDCDFFLADLMSKDGMSIKDKLKVVLEKTKYKVLVKANLGGIFGDAYQEFYFKDNQRAYNQFWNRYDRPPKAIYQRYILERRDLLVPQDIREVKGSYYTPEQWVRLSQEYLAKVLGEDWQEEYYVWDCAAGSGNLLRGLTNKYNIYASTLDDSDVKVMHDAIDGGRLNLVKNNVFQFDFLNDGYKKDEHGNWVSDLENCEKIPESLRNILKDPVKRCKLVIYINPPYKEIAGKALGVNLNYAHDLYADKLSVANRELFAQFMIRVYYEIPLCYIGVFSKLKILNGSNFSEFRRWFKPKLVSLFLVPADTFDNVTGEFPIGFQIWDTKLEELFSFVSGDVYEKGSILIGRKTITLPEPGTYFSNWVSSFKNTGGKRIAWLHACTYNDFQTQRLMNIQVDKPINNSQPRGIYIYDSNLLACAVAFSVRQVPEATWINDRDQFLVPRPSWAGDFVFQTDCLVYMLFHGQTRIESSRGINHWIPFYEEEVNSPSAFNSRFMADFLHGKIERKPIEITGDIFEQQEAEEAAKAIPIENLSPEARAVLEAGKEIWKYYMSKPGISANASFLDIRAFFQGYKTTDKGKRMMNSTSGDETYMNLLKDLREKMKALEAHIEPKIYEHGFLLR